MSTISIHGVPASTFTRTVRMACHEKGIDYELVPTGPADIGALNPFHKIPAITHDGFTLYESTAILRYLDRTFAGTRLWPDDSREAAICDQWTSAICDSFVGSALHYVAIRFGFFSMPPEVTKRHLERTRQLVPVFDARLAGSRFLAGDEMTAADLFLLPIMSYFPDVPELEAIADTAPHCARWLGEMHDRQSVRATDPEMKPQLAA